VLVVEDDSDTLQLIVEVLEEEGFRAQSCVDGDQALKLLKQEAFDLVLADIKMPRMTGIDLMFQIRNLGLDRIVVASCSPLMHEPTFRGACEQVGMNRYLFQMANIREHCSWVTVEPAAATDKAKALMAAAVAKAAHLQALPRKTVPVLDSALVVGGGIAGIQAALDIADSGRTVYLVEKEASIGGHMARFDKTFPTLDCAACILTPKMVQVGKHPEIRLMSSSEVEEVSGFVGNFKVKIRRRAKYVDHSKCTGCGLCWESCPARMIPAARVIRKGKLIIGRTIAGNSPMAGAGRGNGHH
jgi:heterodisulfide reductase subunit A-like polyferredoxin